MRYYNQAGVPQGQTMGTPSNPSGALPDCSTFNNDCNCYYGGCTDPTAQNYDPTKTCDDGSCIAGIFGCTTPGLLNFDPNATYDDGSCGPTAVEGCTDPAAANHNSQANTGCGWSQGPAVPSPGTGGGGQNPPPPQNFAGSYANFNEAGFGGINDRRGAGFINTDRSPFVMSTHHLNASGQLWF